MEIREILKSMAYGPAPEDATAVREWLMRHEGGFGHFIDGAFTAPGETFDTRDPARGAVLARVSQGRGPDVDAAVAAARRAQEGWAALDGHDRARHLYALARHVQQHARFLAVLETLDTGKPIRESRDIDVPLVARHFYHHAGWAELLADEFPGERPWGVCGQVIPWNFPLLMLAWKVAPALAAGNTVVLKPAEYTPLTALAFAEICVEVGLPKGVVNIVTGDGETGAAVVAHGGVDKVAFTGSTEVGRAIRRVTAGTGKGLTLELGGKSPFIVFEDADLDAAVEGVVDAIWFNQGQVCCAGARVLVAEAVEARFTARLKARMATLIVGDPLDKNTDMGAIVDPVQLERIRALVAQGRAEGAAIHEGQAPEGCYHPPIIATGVGPANVLSTEEIFGPVVTLTSFRTPAEAVELANNTRYGLAASLWSENVSLCLDVAGQVKAGIVWINCTNVFDAGAAFGGYRESGFGREGGREGMKAYLRPPERTGVPSDLPSPQPQPQPQPAAAGPTGGIDRTAKLHIGGRQARPDSGYAYAVEGAGGVVGLAALGNCKDIRNAVEAAAKAGAWSATTGHGRAQILYYLGENLAARKSDFALRLRAFGQTPEDAEREVGTAIRRIFWYAAWADKVDGAVHATTALHLTLALSEPLGVMGLVCPTERPLLGLVSLMLPALAMGNRVVAVPSQVHPLVATDLCQVIDTSDVPAGVFSLVSGPRDDLARTLAQHDGVDAVWYVGAAARMIETESAGNLKQTWTEMDGARDWMAPEGQGRAFLDRARQTKTVWVPYGA